MSNLVNQKAEFVVQTFRSSLAKQYDVIADRDAFEQQLLDPPSYDSKQAVDAAGKPIIPGKGQKVASWGCPLFSPGLRKSGQRKGEVPSTFWYAVVEHDAGTVPFETAVEALQRAGIDAIVYTSASHDPAAPRWRVVAPLQAPCDVDGYLQHLDTLNGVLGDACSPESADPTRQWFYGRVAATGEHYRSARTGGAPLDTLTELPSTPLARKAKAASRERSDLPTPVSLQRLESALAFLDPNDYEYFIPGKFSWLTVVNAVKYEAQQAGDLPAGAQILHTWSSRYRQRNGYSAAETDLQYNYSDPEHENPTTGASIIDEVHRVAQKTGRLWMDPAHVPNADGFEDITLAGQLRARAALVDPIDVLTPAFAATVAASNDASERIAVREVAKGIGIVEQFDVAVREAAQVAIDNARESSATKTPKFSVMHCDEAAVNIRGAAWLIKDVLPKAGVVVVYGAPGSGKTFATLDMAFAVARGLPEWHGRKARQGAVVYVAGEAFSGVRRRVAAYKAEHEVNGAPLGVIGDVPNLFTNEDDARRVAEQIQSFSNSIGEPVELVILDTLAAVAAGMDENAVKDMSHVLGQAKQIGDATGATVLVVHHTNKSGEMRGSTALLGAADAVLGVESRGKGARTILVEKQKDGETGVAFAFRLKRVVLGVDEDLNEISSCIVEPVGEATQQANKQKNAGIKVPPLRGIKRDVYAVVVALGGAEGAEVAVADIVGRLRIKVENEGGEFRPTRIEQAIQTLVRDGTFLRGTGVLPTLRFPPSISLEMNDTGGGGLRRASPQSPEIASWRLPASPQIAAIATPL